MAITRVNKIGEPRASVQSGIPAFGTAKYQIL